ncbi:MAG: rhodanese-like domain-containing protein [Candidatus Neomarinimicrobiota bacterium]|nr:MAG: rhodanese-like domain-containing protein [Candidatus Neomarinimicrobiota bacterium]
MKEDSTHARVRIHVKPRILLTIVIGILGLVIAMVPENTTQPYKLTADQLLAEIQSGSEMVSPDALADWLVNEDPSIQLIDVRTPKEYENYHLDAALNIPLAEILSPEWSDYLDQGVKMNILYSNGTTTAHEAWMILRQMGYENNYVLQGGLNYWTETILNPTAPKVTSPDDEFARYDFRKAASQKFGGGSIQTTQVPPPKKKPPIKRRAKKRAPEGGC